MMMVDNLIVEKMTNAKAVGTKVNTEWVGGVSGRSGHPAKPTHGGGETNHDFPRNWEWKVLHPSPGDKKKAISNPRQRCQEKQGSIAGGEGRAWKRGEKSGVPVASGEPSYAAQ